MRAAVYEDFTLPLSIQNVPDPEPNPDGVVIRVMANGICLSDWHGWMGHDPDITPPHVPGHELSGFVEEVGKNVRRWKKGDRVTLPFVCGCGACPQCLSGNHQVCDHQSQPGFTHWGAFAQYVGVLHADVNLVRLPESLDFVGAACLGCRVVTSFRAVAAQGRVTAGQWVAVHGCGGVGLSAIMIGDALGANVVGVDISEDKLRFAEAMGARHTLNAKKVGNIPEAIMDLTGGGVQVSIDALGSVETCRNSIACLRKRGKHVQVGLMPAESGFPKVPMDRVIAHELEIIGSHGIQAHKYDELLEMIVAGKLNPKKLVGKTVTLRESLNILETMDQFQSIGVTVIDSF